MIPMQHDETIIMSVRPNPDADQGGYLYNAIIEQDDEGWDEPEPILVQELGSGHNDTIEGCMEALTGLIERTLA